jgi:hypothetical protein
MGVVDDASVELDCEPTGCEPTGCDPIVCEPMGDVMLASVISGEDDCPISDPLASPDVFGFGEVFGFALDAPHPSDVALSRAPDIMREIVLCMTTDLGG